MPNDFVSCPRCNGRPQMTGDGSGGDGAGNYHHPPCALCGDRCEVPQAVADAFAVGMEHVRDRVDMEMRRLPVLSDRTPFAIGQGLAYGTLLTFIDGADPTNVVRASLDALDRFGHMTAKHDTVPWTQRRPDGTGGSTT